jgi:hypothetical protein
MTNVKVTDRLYIAKDVEEDVRTFERFGCDLCLETRQKLLNISIGLFDIPLRFEPATYRIQV